MVNCLSNPINQSIWLLKFLIILLHFWLAMHPYLNIKEIPTFVGNHNHFLLFSIVRHTIDIHNQFQQVVMSSFDKMDDVWKIHSNVVFWMLLYFIHMNKHSSFISLGQSLNDQVGCVIVIVFTEGVLGQLNFPTLWWFIQPETVYICWCSPSFHVAVSPAPV